MRFVHTAKNYQLVIENGEDLKSALTLDEALWVAVSAPVADYTCDKRFLEYVNDNHSLSISSEEVKKAIQWLLEVYPHPEKIDGCFNGKLTLSELSPDSADAKVIRHSAEYINRDLKAEEPTVIDLATVRRFQEILTSRPLNGDGVISVLAATMTKEAAYAQDMDACVKDVVAATGGSKDADGTMGMTQAQFKEFWDAIPGYLAWKEAGRIPEGQSTTDVMVMGAQTPELYALLNEHADLVGDFFKLCELRSYDSRLQDKVMESDGKPAVLDPTVWPGMESHLKALPLCQPAGTRSEIPLGNLDYINPLYRAWWSKMVVSLIRPVLGDDAAILDAAGWKRVVAKLAPYAAYLASKSGAICDAVPEERLRRYAAIASLPELVADLTERDLAVAAILKEAAAVEKLLLYRQLMVSFCNNFVSFLDIYNGNCDSLVSRGRIVIDGRWFNATFPVNDMGAHSAMAAKSNLFVIYFEVEAQPKAYTLCAPVTIGDKGCLTAGKRGIYFDRTGHEYNAKITKVIENPVCIKEALLAPFSKFGKMIEDKVGTLSSASQTAIEGQMANAINDPGAAAKNASAAAKTAAAKPKTDKSGMMMGVGVMFAALSSAIAFICKTFSSMSWLSILVSLLCVLLALFLPISLLAFLKLQRQDLSMLLEGNGWALNSRLKLTFRQRQAFSRHGVFPADALGTPRRRWRAIIAWILGIIIALCLAYTAYTMCPCHCNKDEAADAQLIMVCPATEAPAPAAQ